SAIGSGISANLPLAGGTAGGAMARVGVASALTQEIGVVTGLQRKFDWRGVAASALGAGLGFEVGEALGLPRHGFPGGMAPGEFLGKSFVKGMAAGLTTAVARGGKVSVQQVAVDAFGNALGSGLAAVVSRPNYTAEEAAGDYAHENNRSASAAALNASAGGNAYTGGEVWAADVAARRAANPVYRAPIIEDGMLGGLDDVNGMDLQSDQYRAPRTYTVQRGDNPASIGRAIYGDERAGAAILAASSLNASVRDARRLQVGQVLTFPDVIDSQAIRAGGSLIRANNSIRIQEAEANAYALRMRGGPRGGTGDAYADALVGGNLLEASAFPTDADGQLIRYGEQMRNVGRFVGDLGIGAVKGLNNLIPETLAFGFRMTGYAAAALTSLVSTDVSDRMFAQYGRVTGRVFDYDSGVQEFGGLVAQLAAPTIFKGFKSSGSTVYEFEHNAKKIINYDYRHFFSGTTTLEVNATFYSYKSSKYLTHNATYASKELWLTPELMTSRDAVQKLALPRASGYDAVLTVTLRAGTKIMTPRPVWSLFGRPGGGVETRAYVPIDSSMYRAGLAP
ncbi:MAG TPA: hypothetical protein VEA40_14295, partial [Ramlibacter sp.]|nr:hypothetical protein [Ramlibacter sp.]